MIQPANVLNHAGNRIADAVFLQRFQIHDLAQYHNLLSEDLQNLSTCMSIPSDEIVLQGVLGDYQERALRDAYLSKTFGAVNCGHMLDGCVVSKNIMLVLFEETYRRFFQQQPTVLRWVSDNFSDVVDGSIEDTASGQDYDAQNNCGNHFQDIAIRRILYSQGMAFQGEDLLKARNADRIGGFLSPGQMPFFMPEKTPILAVYGWWKKGSLEEFYQRSKIAVVKGSEFVSDVISQSTRRIFMRNEGLGKFWYIDKATPWKINYITGPQLKALARQEKHELRKVNQPNMLLHDILEAYAR